MKPDIRAQIDDSSGHIVLDAPAAPRFKRIIGGIGWADPHHDTTEHWVLVAGEKTDDTLVFMHEYSGSFNGLQQEAINLKDRLLISEYWIDIRERDLHIQLEQVDGLTRYESLGLDYFDRPIWVHESTHWPFFRNRDTLCHLMAVDQLLFTDALKGLNRVTSFFDSGLLRLHSDCVTCRWVLDQYSASDVLFHPLAKAMAYAAWALRKPDQPGGVTWEPKNPYQNLK